MTSPSRRHDADVFIEEWAPDLAALVRDAWPHLRYVGPRVIDAHPGLLITGARGQAARYPFQLNAFLYLSNEGLATFFQDDLIAYARFNAGLRTLDVYCLGFDVDLAGASQADPKTKMISLDPRIAPQRR